MPSSMMHPLAKEAFAKIEHVYGCSVIHSEMMGSRAAGFQSPVSDYDIHFIYVFTKNRYTQLDPLAAETIVFKMDDTIEFHGYELKHYLKLLRKSNTFPSELLWTTWGMPASKIVGDLQHLAAQYMNPVPHWYNHNSIAFKEMQKFRDSGMKDLKAFLYFARSLFSCMVLEQNPTRSHLPIKLIDLIGEVVNLQDGIQAHVKYLVKSRNAGKEDVMVTPQIFTAMQLLLSERVPVATPEENKSLDPRPLDRFFREVINGSYFWMPPDNDRLYTESPLEILKYQLGLRTSPIARDRRIQ